MRRYRSFGLAAGCCAAAVLLSTGLATAQRREAPRNAELRGVAVSLIISGLAEADGGAPGKEIRCVGFEQSLDTVVNPSDGKRIRVQPTYVKLRKVIDSTSVALHTACVQDERFQIAVFRFRDTIDEGNPTYTIAIKNVSVHSISTKARGDYAEETVTLAFDSIAWQSGKSLLEFRPQSQVR